jgi:hypothetical protein
VYRDPRSWALAHLFIHLLTDCTVEVPTTLLPPQWRRDYLYESAPYSLRALITPLPSIRDAASLLVEPMSYEVRSSDLFHNSRPRATLTLDLTLLGLESRRSQRFLV